MREIGPGIPTPARPPARAARPLHARLRGSALWRSVVRHPSLDTARGRALRGFSNVFLHLYPVRVPWRVLGWRYSFRLGFASAVLYGVLLVTGVYLMFFYTPAVPNAYGDMQRLRTDVWFGQLLRNVHRWSAHLMVLAVILHLARVYWDGAYRRPREYNWVIGVGLLVVTLAYSFTGYLLPWDQLSYWAVAVGSDLLHYVPVIGGPLRDALLGGRQIGHVALLRFYVIHVAVLTVAFGLLMSVHLWRVRKDGFAVRRDDAVPGSLPPAARAGTPAAPRVRLLGTVGEGDGVRVTQRPDDTVLTWPHLLVRHAVVALALCAVVLGLGVAFAAPLRDIANPALTPEPAKAPWYFVGMQELLAHFDPLVAGVFVPGGLVLALTALPYVDRNPHAAPRFRRVARLVFAYGAVLALALTVVGACFRGPGWRLVPPWVHLYFEW